MKGKLSASMMCAELDKICYYLQEFKNENLEFLHIDVMDGSFVPNFALGTDYVKKLRKITDIPFDYHFLVDDALTRMSWFEIKKGDIVSFHFEHNNKVLECIEYIKKFNAKAFIAINPDTPIEVVLPYIDKIDGILVMTVYPGFAGKKLVPTSFDKVSKIIDLLKKYHAEHLEVEVDGNITLENAEKFYNLGANIFVSGTSSLFGKSDKTLRDLIIDKRKVIGWTEKEK